MKKKPKRKKRSTHTRSSRPLLIYVDGSSRGNPGPSGVGIAIFPSARRSKPLQEISKYIGITTNNVAEYEAVIQALKWLIQAKKKSAIIKLDSELVYKQITGEYKVRARHIGYQLKRITLLKKNIKDLSFSLIPRTENKCADRLAQKASKKVKISRKTFKQSKLIDL